VLLNPGNGSGPLPNHASFHTVIKAQYLQGPLAIRGGLDQLIHAMQNMRLYVLVQTNNAYDPAGGAQQDSNYQSGELRGVIT
jgi:hypothetical protein